MGVGFGELSGGELHRLFEESSLHEAVWEELRIACRSPEVCQAIYAQEGVLSCLLGRIRGCPEEGTELLKAIINICHHVSAARVPVAEWLNSVFKGGSFAVPGAMFFLFLRLSFLVTIEEEACRLLGASAQFEELLVKPAIRGGDGRCLVEALRIRYNQVTRRVLEYDWYLWERVGILSKLYRAKCDAEFVLRRHSFVISELHVIGSAFNLLLSGEREERCAFEPGLLLKGLTLMCKAGVFADNPNRDYLASTLLVCLDFARNNEGIRKGLRHGLLPPSERYQRELSTLRPGGIIFRAPCVPLDEWHNLLSRADDNISSCSGELLLELCKGRADRLIRHVGFEHVAGFLFSRNLLNSLDGEVANQDASSDEESFKAHPKPQSSASSSQPTSQEEVDELNNLMAKISDYNARMQ